MFSVAYRMLGSVTEAEDVVQEACCACTRAPRGLRSPEAYALLSRPAGDRRFAVGAPSP